MGTEPFYFRRPLSGQQVPVGDYVPLNPEAVLYPEKPSIGLVISTFASEPFVALALAVRNKFYPNLPMLVHDDASPQSDALAALCEKNGAEFQTNSVRLGHQIGDLSAIVGGLYWAKERGLGLLVKMSRRFIPLIDWIPGLSKLAMETQYGTFARDCTRTRFPIRTECFAMSVKHWTEPQVFDDLKSYFLKNRANTSAEGLMIRFSHMVYCNACVAARTFEANRRQQLGQAHPEANGSLPYAKWLFVEPDRAARTPNYLWHMATPPADFARLAAQYGLNYPVQAFSGFWSQGGT